MGRLGFIGAFALISGCSSDSSGNAAPSDASSPTDGSSGAVAAGGSSGAAGMPDGSGGSTAGSGGSAPGGAGSSATGGNLGATGGAAGSTAGTRCATNGDCGQGFACYTGLSQPPAAGYCARRLSAPCDPASGGCPCLDITAKNDHGCEGILGAYCTGTDDPGASWYCAMPP